MIMKRRLIRATAPAGAAISTGKGTPGGASVIGRLTLRALVVTLLEDCLSRGVTALLVVGISIEGSVDTSPVVMGIGVDNEREESNEDVG